MPEYRVQFKKTLLAECFVEAQDEKAALLEGKERLTRDTNFEIVDSSEVVKEVKFPGFWKDQNA